MRDFASVIAQLLFYGSAVVVALFILFAAGVL